MKKIIRNIDEKRGIVQVTIADERWYLRMDGEKLVKAVPSVTWIAGKYPKGVQFYKWLAEKGWDEAEAIKQAAAVKGSKTHQAIDAILQGLEVRIDSKFVNHETGQEEELTLEECDAILSFIAWKKEKNPKTIMWEKTVFSDKHDCAGTIDHLYRLEGEDANTIHLQDFKTSSSVWKEYELQVSAYKELLVENIQSGEIVIPRLNVEKPINVVMDILQVGYKRNKNGYKQNDIEDKFPLFLTAKEIWKEEHSGEQPNKRDYPIVLSEGMKPEDIKFNK